MEKPVLSSATVGDLTDNRVVIAGSSGALEDDANLTFDGSTLALGAALDVNGDGHDIAGTIALDNVNTSGITTTTSVRGYSSLFSTKAAATTTFVVTVASKTSDHRYNGSGSSSGYFIDGQESQSLPWFLVRLIASIKQIVLTAVTHSSSILSLIRPHNIQPT